MEIETQTQTPRSPASRLLWFGLGLTAALVLVFLLLFVLQMRANWRAPLPILGQVADFTLTNQNGTPVSLTDLSGHVWVADIIFTRCAGPCLKMSKQLKDIQDALPPRSQARLVSLTTDPEYDTPPVLAKYAQRFGADSNRWIFLTGTKKQIATVANESLKLTAIEKAAAEQQGPADLFIHSTILVIVDKHGRLRGIFETSGEGVDPVKTRADVLAAVRHLERES